MKIEQLILHSIVGLVIPLSLMSGCKNSSDDEPSDKVLVNVKPDSSSSSEPALSVADIAAQSNANSTPQNTSTPSASEKVTVSVSDQPPVESSSPITSPQQPSAPKSESLTSPVASTGSLSDRSTQSISDSTPIETPRRDYDQIQAPSSDVSKAWSTKEWVTYLAQIDRASQSLMLDRDGSMISASQFSNEALRLAELKLQASEILMSLDDKLLNKELGIIGKIEALSSMAGLGDRDRAAELLEFAKEHSSFESKEVARQAALVLLGFSINGLSTGITQPESVLEQIDVVLSEPSQLRLREFKMMDQVIGILQRNNNSDAANQAITKTITAFKANPDPSIAYTVWQMEIANDSKYQTLVQTIKSESPEPGRVSNALNDFFKTHLNDWSLYWVANEIRNVEFAGHDDAAAVIADFVQQNISKIQSNQVQELVSVEVNSLILHRRMLKQPFVPQELQDLQGTAFDIGSLRGKVVLIVYWASWCSTCRAEFPELKELYKQHQANGFEIVGINLDDSPAPMSGVIQAFELPGIQLRSSNPAKIGVNTQAAQQVGLRATPFSLLLDRSGNVVSVQAHGTELRELLPKLLNDATGN